MTGSPLVPAYVRYSCAWAELGQRVVTRGQLNFGHIATIVALIAAYISIQPSSGASSASVVPGIDNHFWPAILMPLVSFIFVCWHRHNELIIGALSLFCGHMEKCDYDSGVKLPPYFHRTRSLAEQRKLNRYCLQDYVLQFRRWSDNATIAICVASPVLTIADFLLTQLQKPDPLTYSVFEVGQIGIVLWCLLLSVIVVRWLVRIQKYRERILDGTYDDSVGLFSLEMLV